MSRNLLRVDCYFCESEVTLDEAPRLLAETDTRTYFDEYAGMIVANASCTKCRAKYLGWVVESPSFAWRHRICPRIGTDPSGRLAHFDLSFRSTFNDEPGSEDMPDWTPGPTWGVSNHCDGAMWQPAGESREEAIAFGRRVFPEHEETTFFVAELEPWEPGDLLDAATIAQTWLHEYAWEAHVDGAKAKVEFPTGSLRDTLRAWARKHLSHLHKWQTCSEPEEVDVEPGR